MPFATARNQRQIVAGKDANYWEKISLELLAIVYPSHQPALFGTATPKNIAINMVPAAATIKHLRISMAFVTFDWLSSLQPLRAHPHDLLIEYKKGCLAHGHNFLWLKLGLVTCVEQKQIFHLQDKQVQVIILEIQVPIDPSPFSPISNNQCLLHTQSKMVIVAQGGVFYAGYKYKQSISAIYILRSHQQ